MYSEFHKVSLERPQRLKATVQVADEDFFPYAVKLATQQMLDRCGTEITLRGAALYNYARFEGDCDLETPKILRSTHTENHPASFRDHVLLVFFGWIKKLVYLVSKRIVCKDQLPKWLYPIERTIEVLDEKGIQVYRIQEALFAQMYMLKRLKLKPQAILASPDIANDLVAYQSVGMEVVYCCGRDLMFASLPVIVCPELIQGAIVV